MDTVPSRSHVILGSKFKTNGTTRLHDSEYVFTCRRLKYVHDLLHYKNYYATQGIVVLGRYTIGRETFVSVTALREHCPK